MEAGAVQPPQRRAQASIAQINWPAARPGRPAAGPAVPAQCQPIQARLHAQHGPRHHRQPQPGGALAAGAAGRQGAGQQHDRQQHGRQQEQEIRAFQPAGRLLAGRFRPPGGQQALQAQRAQHAGRRQAPWQGPRRQHEAGRDHDDGGRKPGSRQAEMYRQDGAQAASSSIQHHSAPGRWEGRAAPRRAPSAGLPESQQHGRGHGRVQAPRKGRERRVQDEGQQQHGQRRLPAAAGARQPQCGKRQAQGQVAVQCGATRVHGGKRRRDAVVAGQIRQAGKHGPFPQGE